MEVQLLITLPAEEVSLVPFDPSPRVVSMSEDYPRLLTSQSSTTVSLAVSRLLLLRQLPSIASIVSCSLWVIDSGAFAHMTGTPCLTFHLVDMTSLSCDPC